jgi:threonine dehydrogenase-like Zn-dependent dehydrogenase
MRAVRSTPRGVAVVDVEEPAGPGELVHVHSASICGSDFGYIRGGSRRILGHELSGVTDAGEVVAIEPIFGCGHCRLCAAGRPNLCRSMPDHLFGSTVDGGMVERIRVPRSNLLTLPPDLRPSDGCLVEPGAVAWHAARKGAVGPDVRVAVVGGGAIGLLAVAACRALGATDVALDARYAHQIEAGERLGATRVSDTYDVVIEAAGSESSLYRSFDLVRPEGTVVFVGVQKSAVEWPHQEAFFKEIVTVPAIGYTHTHDHHEFAEVAAVLAADPEIAATVITHRFPLADAVHAFRVASDRSSGALRVVLEPER